MQNQTFSAAIDDWVRKTEQRMEAVVKTATQNLFFEVLKPTGQGGRMRIDTGFLRASFQASVNEPVNLSLANPDPRREGDGDDVKFEPDTGAISLVINSVDIGQTIYGTFTANYARAREFGARGQPPDAFVLANAINWTSFVTEAVSEVRAAVQ